MDIGSLQLAPYVTRVLFGFVSLLCYITSSKTVNSTFFLSDTSLQSPK